MGNACKSSVTYAEHILKAMRTQTERALDNRARKDAPTFGKAVFELFVIMWIIWYTSAYWKPTWEKVWIMHGCTATI
jgi:hypothetical protein